MAKTGMSDDLRTLARDLTTFMVKQHGIRDIDGPAPLADDWRRWELSFTYKGHNVLRDQKVEIPVSVPTLGQSGNLLAELNMLPLEFVGRYDFNLYVGDNLAGTISLNVEVGPQSGFGGGQQQIGQA